MTIEEAVEIYRKQPHQKSISESIQASAKLADQYIRLTDPTPLTRELIEKELGKPDHVFAPSKSVEWTIGRHGVRWYYNRLLLDRLDLKFITTLGDLRQIVRMLRGGGN